MSKFLSFFTRLDVIGPEVRFFSRNEYSSRRQTLIGAFLSILVYFSAFSVSIYFLLDIFIRKSPKTNQINSYLDDTPRIAIASSQITFAVKFETLDNSIQYSESYAVFRGFLKLLPATVNASYEFTKCRFERDFKGFEEQYFL